MTAVELLDPPRGTRALGSGLTWLGAAAAAFAAHALAVALALHQPPTAADAGAPPAVLLELAPVPAAPPADIDENAPDLRDAPDVPPPPPDLAPLDPAPPPTAAPELPAPGAADVPLPPPTPPPPAPAPRDPVASPDPAPRPLARPADLPQPEPQPEPDPEPPSPPQTTARSRQPAPAAAPVAPQAARGTVPQTSPAEWRSLLLAHFERAKRYPARARDRGQEGVAQVRFAIDAAGTVLGVELFASSGVPALDEEAVAMVARASPVPPPPPGVPRDFTMPVHFDLR